MGAPGTPPRPALLTSVWFLRPHPALHPEPGTRGRTPAPLRRPLLLHRPRADPPGAAAVPSSLWLNSKRKSKSNSWSSSSPVMLGWAGSGLRSAPGLAAQGLGSRCGPIRSGSGVGGQGPGQGGGGGGEVAVRVWDQRARGVGVGRGPDPDQGAPGRVRSGSRSGSRPGSGPRPRAPVVAPRGARLRPALGRASSGNVTPARAPPPRPPPRPSPAPPPFPG